MDAGPRGIPGRREQGPNADRAPIVLTVQQIADPLRCTLAADLRASERQRIAPLRKIYREVRGKPNADSDWRYFEGVYLHRARGLSNPEASRRVFGSARQADEIRYRDYWVGDRDYLIDFYRRRGSSH